MTMNKQQWGLLGSAGAGAGLGAGLMFLLDPQAGRRRRSVAKDKTVHVLRAGGNACARTSRDLGNRSKGMVLGAASKLRREEVDATTLTDRVRSQLGRAVSHPSSIEVLADETGRVVLTGSVLGPEHAGLLKTVRKVKGVHEVEDRLYVYQEASNLPELQEDEGSRSWKPSPRLLAGTALGIAGLGLLARELTNRKSRSAVETGNGSASLDFQESAAVESSRRLGEDLAVPETESSLHQDRLEPVHF